MEQRWLVGVGEVGAVRVGGVAWSVVRAAALRAFERATAGRHARADSWVVFESIVRLSWYHSRTAPGGAAYAVCSEQWLAGRVGLRREAISHTVHRLEAWGLLRVLNRRPVRGAFQTNLYRFAGGMISALASTLRSLLTRRPSLKNDGVAFPMEEALRVRSSVHGELGELVQRWVSRGAVGSV